MVSKFLDLKNLSWQSRPFLLSNNRRKVWATVLFLSAIIHRKVIHVNCFVFSFCHIWRTTGCWDPEILLPWQRDVTTSETPEGNHCKSVKRSRNDRNARRRVGSPSKAASLIRQTIYAVSSWFCGKRCYNVGALKFQVVRMCACSADATFAALWKFGQNGKSDWPFLL